MEGGIELSADRMQILQLFSSGSYRIPLEAEGYF